MTIKQLNKELEARRTQAQRSGIFGLDACKESIKFDMKFDNLTINQVYAKLIERALTEPLFNLSMIIACEEMM